MSDFGKLSPVAHEPNTQTLAPGYAPFITFEILSTTDCLSYLSASVGEIYWTKSRISECINKKMSFIRSVCLESQGYCFALLKIYSSERSLALLIEKSLT